MSGTFQCALRIQATHPALAGHFPDHPVVPGVVLLERVVAACRSWRGMRVGKFDAKFLQPLLPDQNAVIELREEGPRVRFAVLRAEGGVALARGTLEAAS
ncbi:MAG: hydroxymyristoyl-ACP dehydratase [Rhodanobacteraceae bacterium]